MSTQGDEPRGRRRLLIVVPSTAEYDSRTYRIASSMARRGHDVTVLARLADGLPVDEQHPAGYRIVRVRTDAIGGLPALLRPVASLARARAGFRGTAPGSGHPIRSRDPTATGDSRARTTSAARHRSGLRPRLRAVWSALVRLAAIGLTVRSQRLAALDVGLSADLVHAMAYMGVPVGLAVASRARAPVIYDARDIYVDAGNLARMPGPARSLFAALERRWARRAARVVTANEPYAEVMAERWRVDRPFVLMNCAYRPEPGTRRPRRFHAALPIDPGRAVVLYQGGFSPERGIEQLVQAMTDVPDAALVLLGYGQLEGLLRDLAGPPRPDSRVFVLPAVAPTDLIEWVASADIVAIPIQPTTLNHRLTTPNKLFEAMAAGVAVVAADLPGMARIVRETGCGVLVDPTDPTAIAARLRELVMDPAARERMGRAGLEAARSVYNWEAQAERLAAEYGRLTGLPW